MVERSFTFPVRTRLLLDDAFFALAEALPLAGLFPLALVAAFPFALGLAFPFALVAALPFALVAAFPFAFALGFALLFALAPDAVRAFLVMGCAAGAHRSRWA